MSKTKIPHLRRLALYEAYSQKCVYCNKPLDWNVLEIDHVVPECETNISEIIKEYGLPEDFNVNDTHNLLPCHSWCNNRKGKELFPPASMHYYLMLAKRHQKKVTALEKQLERKTRRNRLTALIESYVESEEMNVVELYQHVQGLYKSKWNEQAIVLPQPVLFKEIELQEFLPGKDYSFLQDLHIGIYPEGYDITLVDENDNLRKITTLKEWRDLTSKGYYPLANVDIIRSFAFDFLDKLLEMLLIAKAPEHSFLKTFNLSNLHSLSSELLIDIEDRLKEFQPCTIGELVGKGLVTVDVISNSEIRLEYDGFLHYFKEQFRADLNDDGLEEIFVSVGCHAVGGSIGWGDTFVLGKCSKLELVHSVSSDNANGK